MPNGWAQLGSELLGGPDPNAYDKGRVFTAQTEEALAKARAAQADAIAKDVQAKARDATRAALAQAGFSEADAGLADTLLGAGYGDFNQVMHGLGTRQEMGFRDVAGNPASGNRKRQAALAAISGKPFSPLEAVGPASYTDITADNPTLMTTPYGESSIAENNAQAANAYASANKTQDEMLHPERYRAPSTAAPKVTDALGNPVETGMIPNPNYDPSLPPDMAGNPLVIPQAGSSKDPAAGGAWGTRERMMLSSVLHSALEAGQRLSVTMNMPAGADRGFFDTGFGGHRGVGIMSAMAGNMTWGISDEEVNDYNTVMSGQARNLANLENYGRGAPTQGQIDAIYQALALRPGSVETVKSKMYKMADYRNTVENALHTFQAMNPRMPPDVVTMIEDTLKGLTESVPFTLQDVNALTAAQQKNPRATLKDVMTQRMMTAPARPQQPQARPGSPAVAPVPLGTDADGWVEVQPGVRVRLKPGQ